MCDRTAYWGPIRHFAQSTWPSSRTSMYFYSLSEERYKKTYWYLHPTAQQWNLGIIIPLSYSLCIDIFYWYLWNKNRNTTRPSEQLTTEPNKFHGSAHLHDNRVSISLNCLSIPAAANLLPLAIYKSLCGLSWISVYVAIQPHCAALLTHRMSNTHAIYTLTFNAERTPTHETVNTDCFD